MLRAHLFQHFCGIDISTDGQTQREIENFRQHRRGNTHKTKRFSGLMHRLCQRL
ncbi:Uncharacterised protein [Shigella sonnei]|nr:Uncharacterised protein [Shigella sonnei]CSF02696.1 Uncharacterised protein [Shigella sonnei]CSG32994.1 Uncharacterised protein [Shigella sonnei]CSH41984.1 Uncharacterised protein [Shigella sonnei]